MDMDDSMNEVFSDNVDMYSDDPYMVDNFDSILQ